MLLWESLGYIGGGIGFGGQMVDWMFLVESVDVVLLFLLCFGNVWVDDLVCNNGIVVNVVVLYKDYIVGYLFFISYCLNWCYFGMCESVVKSFVDEVEVVWIEYCDGIFGEMDVEGKWIFIEFICEGVGVYVFNGEIFFQFVWDVEIMQVFCIWFKVVSLKWVDILGYVCGNCQFCVGVEMDWNGKVFVYYVCDDDWLVVGGECWICIFCFLLFG